MRLSYLMTGLLACCFQGACSGGDNDWRAYSYIETYKQLAIDEMFRMGVPASIKLAQGMLETEYGTSRLSNDGKNHFGIKCKDYWVGDTILVDDDAPQECFRRYSSAADSFIDHSMFLRYHPKQNYTRLFELNPRDYFGWAYGLKEGGYATNSRYAEALIGLIERYELYQFDDYVLAQLKGEKLIPIAQTTMVFKPNLPPPATNPQTTHTNPKATHANPMPSAADRVFKPTSTSEARAETAMVKKFIAQTTQENKPTVANTSSAQPDNTTLEVRELCVNNTHALIANKELSVFYVAYLYGIPMKKLYQYNELDLGLKFKAGLPIFLANKQKDVAKGISTYIAQSGESLYDIAQRFGVKLKKVRHLNPQLAQAGTRGGETIKLR